MDKIGYDRTGFSFPLEDICKEFSERGTLTDKTTTDLLNYVQSSELMICSLSNAVKDEKNKTTELKAKLYDLQNKA